MRKTHVFQLCKMFLRRFKKGERDMDKKVMMAKLFRDAKDDLMLFRRVFLPVEDEVRPLRSKRNGERYC